MDSTESILLGRDNYSQVHKYWDIDTILIFSVLYTSDSQPGVRVPLGVRKHTAGGTWKHLIITCVTLYFLRIINMGVLMVWQIGSGGTQDKKGWETLLYTTTMDLKWNEQDVL